MKSLRFGPQRATNKCISKSDFEYKLLSDLTCYIMYVKRMCHRLWNTTLLIGTLYSLSSIYFVFIVILVCLIYFTLFLFFYNDLLLFFISSIPFNSFLNFIHTIHSLYSFINNSLKTRQFLFVLNLLGQRDQKYLIMVTLIIKY